MSHLGEISTLTKIAKPTIAIITNVGTAHIGNLGPCHQYGYEFFDRDKRRKWRSARQKR